MSPDQYIGPRTAVRISEETLGWLKTFVILDSVEQPDNTLGDQIRAAVDRHISVRKADPNLPAQIEQARERFGGEVGIWGPRNS